MSTPEATTGPSPVNYEVNYSEQKRRLAFTGANRLMLLVVTLEIKPPISEATTEALVARLNVGVSTIPGPGEGGPRIPMNEQAWLLQNEPYGTSVAYGSGGRDVDMAYLQDTIEHHLDPMGLGRVKHLVPLAAEATTA